MGRLSAVEVGTMLRRNTPALAPVGPWEVAHAGEPGEIVAMEEWPEVPVLDGREDYFFDVVRDLFDAGQDRSSGWTVEARNGASEIWIAAYKDRSLMPSQGWKLHVSAAPLYAEKVLRRTVDVLLAEDAAFKVISSIPRLVDLNSGLYGLSQIGKFLTVFPNSDVQALRLARALDRATRGLRGPLVPSDNPLCPGSLVSYRYGGFVRYGGHNDRGDAQLVIHTPAGEEVPDKRGSSFSPPEWATDPFVDAGISTPPAERSPLVAGRYLITSTIDRTARGEIHMAVDLATATGCVVKRSRRNGAMGVDGTDACDRLRNEAAMLSRLAPDPRFPKRLAFFEDDDGATLVMELIEGLTLAEHVKALALQGRHLPQTKVVEWASEVAAMVGVVHSKGWVYRDLKSTNVIVAPDGRLRLLDFDVCQPVGARRALYSPGTVGYMSRRQRANEPPRLAHDVYSFGALLYFIATGAEPSVYSRPYDPLDRPPRLLNPDVSAELEAIIERCLHEDPGERYASMDEVDTALARLDVHKAQAHTARRREPWAAGLRQHYRDMARQLGEALAQTVDALGTERLTWANLSNPREHISSRNFSVGMSGTVYALLELGAELGDKRLLEAARRGADWLAEAEPAYGQSLSGLYTGEAGVAVTLLRAGQVLGEARWTEEALVVARRVASRPHDMPALFSGTAGRLRAHLLIWDATGAPDQLAAAVDAGDALLASAEPVGCGGRMLRWVIPAGYEEHSGKAYTGYAIGAAGTGDALLDLYEATREERFADGARKAARWIASLARPALDDNSGLDWPPTESAELQGAHWGHGAAGIGLFFMHAGKLGILPDARRYARRAARTAARGARWSGPTYGYGLGGNIDCLLDTYQVYGYRTHLDGAFALARLLEAWSVERDGVAVWPTESPAIFSDSYAVGNAGVALCFLRLSDPERLGGALRRVTD